MQEYTPWLKHIKSSHVLGDGLTDYINRADVRTAMNIPTELNGFHLCQGDPNILEYHSYPEASKWIYSVLRNKIKIMFYSGDTDGALPTYGTKKWIQSLKWEKTTPIYQWFTDDQVSGYIEKYVGLDFVTVHGVGHMAPEWKPKPMQQIIMAWIHNEEI